MEIEPVKPVGGSHAHRLRAAFDRVPADGEANARLYGEVAARLLEHLAPVKLSPGVILDLGAGTAALARPLAERFPGASLVALDFSLPRARASARRGRTWFGRSRAAVTPVCGDMRRLPLADASADLVVSNLAVNWIPELAQVLAELRRVCKPGGLVLLSALGPDTLKELRAAWAECDPHPHLLPFADMHDIGDMLMGAGLADAVMDAERITLTYETPSHLLSELRSLDVRAVPGRAPGLITPRRLASLEAAYRRRPENFEPGTGRIRATVELVFAHAWCPEHGARGPVPGGAVEVAAPAPPGRSPRRSG